MGWAVLDEYLAGVHGEPYELRANAAAFAAIFLASPEALDVWHNVFVLCAM